MSNSIDKLEDTLLRVDVELFVKDMQCAINECPQGINDESARWATFYKARYVIKNIRDSKNDCIKWRVRLFTLKDSQTLSGTSYFRYLSAASKEIYHLAKIYEHLLAINKIKESNEIR
jgi:hypothetical protein